VMCTVQHVQLSARLTALHMGLRGCPGNEQRADECRARSSPPSRRQHLSKSDPSYQCLQRGQLRCVDLRASDLTEEMKLAVVLITTTDPSLPAAIARENKSSIRLLSTNIISKSKPRITIVA
jgi:hypothetical protein